MDHTFEILDPSHGLFVCLFVSPSPYRAFQVRVGQLTRSTSLCIHRLTLDFGSSSTTVDLSQVRLFSAFFHFI
ncbi:hypothetical protein Hanom_Chr08g00730181 [Helianthus anomalus]